MPSLRSFLPATFAALALACGPETSGGTSGTTGSGGSTASTTHPISACASDPRAEAYAVGLSQKSADGAIVVRFVDATPAPPSKGSNVWKIEVVDDKGAAVGDAAITVKTWMPDHAHGSSITPQATAQAGGRYEIDLLDFFMPGIWQITLDITPQQGTAESVVFTFCVDG